MHSGAEPGWPVLDGGPAAVAITGARAWRHDGYRMHVRGRGAQLDSVHAGAIVMDSIRHVAGEATTLHADRVESRSGRALHDLWATALELPLLVWERAYPGEVSWQTPAAGMAELSGRDILLRLRESGAQVAFEARAGTLRTGSDGRITWNTDRPDRLLVIAAADDADFDRSRDLLARRTIAGLGRQRVQHAEQLHRGGAAMRAAGIPALADAFDWAKVRGDALLGSAVSGVETPPGISSMIQAALAEGMLAAGLSHLPRALRRRDGADPAWGAAGHGTWFAAWTGEPAVPESVRPRSRSGNESRPDRPVSFAVPAVDEIASGQIDAATIASLLSGSMRELWGVVPDGLHGSVGVAPDIARLGASAALSRLRVGGTVLDVRVRNRGEVASISVRRGAGPPIVMDCRIRGASSSEVLVDGEAMMGGRARFEVREAHDVQFHLGRQPPLSSAPS